ncbi:HD domain-containing protein [Candidatus Pacearchaeota archaeon]|nr:HD domain-containing protein [Candidatus Pacearchaeota archaeon]
MEEKSYQKLKEKVQPYFENAKPCHDFMHTERVLNLALYIGEKESANLEILKLATLLHDIAHQEQDECKGEICHAEKGAEMAKEILDKEGYDKEIINAVAHCIETHRFRNNKIPKSTEAKVLYDADSLDAIGAIGILRACSFSGSIGSLVHNPDVNVENTKRYSKDDSAYREFLFQLKKVKDTMLTKEGKKIAKGRHKYMVKFFDRVNKEVRGKL